MLTTLFGAELSGTLVLWATPLRSHVLAGALDRTPCYGVRRIWKRGASPDRCRRRDADGRLAHAWPMWEEEILAADET